MKKCNYYVQSVIFVRTELIEWLGIERDGLQYVRGVTEWDRHRPGEKRDARASTQTKPSELGDREGRAASCHPLVERAIIGVLLTVLQQCASYLITTLQCHGIPYHWRCYKLSTTSHVSKCLFWDQFLGLYTKMVKLELSLCVTDGRSRLTVINNYCISSYGHDIWNRSRYKIVGQHHCNKKIIFLFKAGVDS